MPTLYLTGVGNDGRSRVVEQRNVTDESVYIIPVEYRDGMPVPVLSGTDASLIKTGVKPGERATSIVRWRPDLHAELHRTHSVDINTVLEGSIVCELEDGEIHLEKGDVVYLPGTVHSWRCEKGDAFVLFAMQGAQMLPQDVGREILEISEAVTGELTPE